MRTFESEGRARSRHVTTDWLNVSLVDSYADDDPNDPYYTIGYCDGANGVTFLKEYWNDASETERELLAFHEFGHCVLGLEHGTCPGIMCEYIGSESDYKANRSAYLDALFK